LYAIQKGYEVEKVFGDSFTGAGDFMNRPAMSKLLSYMDSKPSVEYVVIFDDLKRFARDTIFHWSLRSALNARRAIPKCLNYNFDETPEGKFVETIFAAQNQLDREQNRRQVVQKMKARLEMGYYPFPGLPQGYKHDKVTVHSNSTLVFDEPKASIVKEGLEGFASGRFPEQIDLQRFFREKKLKGNMPIYLEQVKRILVMSSFYAGYIEYKPWEITLRRGQHEGLISLVTHEKIKERLTGKVRTHIKRFLNPDFPLRKFVICGKCHHPLTANQSTSRNGQKKPYYWCNQQTCGELYKAIRRDDIHKEFEDILSKVKPSTKILDLTRVVIEDVWKKKEGEIVSTKKSFTNELISLESERRTVLDRITKARDEKVVSLYEDRLSEISERELVLKDSLMSFDSDKPNIGTALDIVFDFLGNPLVQWQKGDIHRKKLVLNLIFEENLAYNKNSGFETATLSLPLRVFTLPEATETRLVDILRNISNRLKDYLSRFWYYYQASQSLQKTLAN